MSRSISVWYYKNDISYEVEIETNDSLGTQHISKEFWSLPILSKIGIIRLNKLGHLDPIYFSGWEDIAELEIEIELLEKNIDEIIFTPINKATMINIDTGEIKLGDDEYHKNLFNRWIQNLRFCLEELKNTAPVESIPNFEIG